jgi:RNA polymerase sigma factor (sigma-70 family)
MNVAEIFRRHGDDLFRHLARECGDAQLAKDAVQETFVRLQERAPTDDGAIRTWLFRTGMNVVRDWHRRKANRRRLLASHPDRVPGPSAAPDPGARAELGEDVVRLRRALAGLREKERTALLMRESGFTHQEIAEELGTTTATVGTLIARSLRKLAAAMERRGGSA